MQENSPNWGIKGTVFKDSISQRGKYSRKGRVNNIQEGKGGYLAERWKEETGWRLEVERDIVNGGLDSGGVVVADKGSG